MRSLNLKRKNLLRGPHSKKEKFEFVVSRAVTEFPTFYRWVQNKISKNQFNNLPNGILYLKGGDLKEEMKDFEKRITYYNLHYYFKEAKKKI